MPLSPCLVSSSRQGKLITSSRFTQRCRVLTVCVGVFALEVAE